MVSASWYLPGKTLHPAWSGKWPPQHQRQGIHDIDQSLQSEVPLAVQLQEISDVFARYVKDTDVSGEKGQLLVRAGQLRKISETLQGGWDRDDEVWANNAWSTRALFVSAMVSYLSNTENINFLASLIISCVGPSMEVSRMLETMSKANRGRTDSVLPKSTQTCSFAQQSLFDSVA